MDLVMGDPSSSEVYNIQYYSSIMSVEISKESRYVSSGFSMFDVDGMGLYPNIAWAMVLNDNSSISMSPNRNTPPHDFLLGMKCKSSSSERMGTSSNCEVK